MIWKSFRIPLGFFIVGVFWAIFSHPAVSAFAKGFSPGTRELIRTLNHLGFVAVASVVLYFLIRYQQKQLIASEDQYRNLFERNPDPMWIFRIDTLEFVKVNDAAINLYGYSKEEFLSMTPKDVRPQSEREKFIKSVNLAGEGVSKQGIWTHQKKNGELIYTSIVTYDLVFNGEVCRLTMINNVTSLVLKEARIKAQNAALHEIAWLNSHEVRKSLCSVMSLTALLKDTPSEHERREYISMIEQCTNELDGMLKKTNNRVDELKEHGQPVV
jgi:PAS domain S-box-containing protein